MSDSMTIRRAEESDRERLVEIWLGAVRASHAFLTEEQIQDLLPVVRRVLPHQLEVWALAIATGTVVGFLGLSGAKVEALFVAPEWFGRGGGTLLLDYARQMKGPLLVDVNEQNPRAVRFYLDRGFHIIGRSERDGQGNPFPLLHLGEQAESFRQTVTDSDDAPADDR
jgi:putative acetyltransferase